MAFRRLQALLAHEAQGEEMTRYHFIVKNHNDQEFRRSAVADTVEEALKAVAGEAYPFGLKEIFERQRWYTPGVTAYFIQIDVKHEGV